MEARIRYDTNSVEYLALYDGFPNSDIGCMACEFSVERILENVAENGEEHVKLMKLILRNENDEAIKTAK